MSVRVFRIRPGRQIRHNVELPQQIAHNLVGVIAAANLFELGECAGEGGFDFRDGAFRVVLALLVKELFVLDELFSIEVGNDGRAIDRRTGNRHYVEHAHPLDHDGLFFQFKATGGDCQPSSAVPRAPWAAITPPRHPTAMPPMMSKAVRPADKNVTLPGPARLATASPYRAAATR